MEQKGLKVLAILTIIALVLSACSLIYVAGKPAAEPQIVKVDNPVVTETAYNDSVVNAKIDSLTAYMQKDDICKANAEELASEYYSERSNYRLFNGMDELGLSIVEKSDISSVIIKNQEVTACDTDNNDASVVQELKVYYEDSTGEKVKAYLTVETEIVDNDVDSQTISLS